MLFYELKKDKACAQVTYVQLQFLKLLGAKLRTSSLFLIRRKKEAHNSRNGPPGLSAGNGRPVLKMAGQGERYENY